MKNITKALTYLFIMSLLLTAGGLFYHFTGQSNTPSQTPTPTDNTPTPTDNTPVPADDSEFIAKAQEAFNSAIQTWTTDTQAEKAEKKYCNVDGCSAGLNGAFAGYRYNVVVNENGNVVKFYMSNDTFQFGYVGDGLFLDGISATRITDIDPSQVLNITADM